MEKKYGIIICLTVFWAWPSGLIKNIFYIQTLEYKQNILWLLVNSPLMGKRECIMMNTVQTSWDCILLFALWLQLKEEIITEFYRISTSNYIFSWLILNLNSKSYIYIFIYTHLHTLSFVADFWGSKMLLSSAKCLICEVTFVSF